MIEGSERSASIILVNTSKFHTTYLVYWTQKRQMSNGRFMDLPADNTEVPSASSVLRFSPKKISLSPNEKQTVRIVAKRKLGLTSGELRSHLTFQGKPGIDDDRYPFEIGPPIRSQYYHTFSVPVIVRQGSLDASAKITSLKLRKLVKEMGNMSYSARITLNGAGKNTSTGTLKVFWKRKKTSEFRQIGSRSNITLYPEAASVQFKVNLGIKNASDGFMRVIYEGTEEFKGQTFGTLNTTVKINDYKFQVDK